MKKLLCLLVLLVTYVSLSAQAYRGIRIAETEYNTRHSYTGIVIDSFVVKNDGAYRVGFYNSNRNDPYDGVSYKTSYEFEWYLSYKGKRVSDYYKSTIRCKEYEYRTIYAWPNTVPIGYERYVTVQFGRAKSPKDRRDDD